MVVGGPQQLFLFALTAFLLYTIEGGQPVCMLGVAVVGDAIWLVVGYGAGLSCWLP